jgi:putative membrane protein
MDNQFDIEIHGKRLSAKSIAYKFARQLPQIALYAYFGIYMGNGENWILLSIFLFFSIFAVPSILLSFFYFRYLITPQELIIKSGVVSRKQRNIPLKRIQNVNIQQNFLQRILGISTVKLETAGDATSEAVLDSVGTLNANEIKQIIKEYQAKPETSDKTDIDIQHENIPVDYESSNSERPTSEIKELINMSVWDVTKYGILRFRPILIVAMGWIVSMYQQFMPQEFSRIDENIYNFMETYIDGFDYMSTVIYVSFAVVIALFLSWLADIFLTVIQFFGFKLSIEGNKLYTNYGLLTRRQGTIPLKKLQMMVLFSNVIREKFGYWGLNIETAGTAGRQGKAPEVAVPFAKKDIVIELAKGIKDFNVPEEFIPVSSKTIRRAFLRYFWLINIVSLVLYFTIDMWWLAYCFLPVGLLLAFLRFKSRGFYLDENRVLIKTGWFFKKITIIQIDKIQNVIYTSTFFQRLMGLASLNLDTAAGSGFNDASITDISIEQANELSEKISTEFHLSNKSIKIQ